MHIIRDIYSFNKKINIGSSITIGNYDAMHKGHIQNINNIINKANILNLKKVIIIFYPTTHCYFKKIRQNLYSIKEKLIFLKKKILIILF